MGVLPVAWDPGTFYPDGVVTGITGKMPVAHSRQASQECTMGVPPVAWDPGTFYPDGGVTGITGKMPVAHSRQGYLRSVPWASRPWLGIPARSIPLGW